MNKTDEANQTTVVLDGHQIWNAMRRLSFDGKFFFFNIF
jgi:hypothetical protein